MNLTCYLSPQHFHNNSFIWIVYYNCVLCVRVTMSHFDTLTARLNLANNIPFAEKIIKFIHSINRFMKWMYSHVKVTLKQNGNVPQKNCVQTFNKYAKTINQNNYDLSALVYLVWVFVLFVCIVSYIWLCVHYMIACVRVCVYWNCVVKKTVCVFFISFKIKCLS